MRKTRFHGISHMAAATAIAASLAGWAGIAYAQDNIAALDDIIVTAQRKSENLQNVPISINATSGENIRAMAKTDLQDVLRDVPAVRISAQDSGAAIYVRGVGSNLNTQIGSPAVNLNIDGVYQQQSEVPLGQMFDIARVEVLRGPQGTLYGRNANAGAINIITNDPVLDAVHARGSVDIGNYSKFRTEGMINVPLTDDLAVRGAFATERRDGYLHPSGYDNADSKAARLKFLYEPNARLRIIGGYDYLSLGGQGRGSATWPDSGGDDPWHAEAPAGMLRARGQTWHMQLDWDLDWAKLTFLPSHTTFDRYSISMGPNDDYGTQSDFDTRQTTAELRLNSASSSVIDWTLGLYYLRGGQGQTRDLTKNQTSIPLRSDSYKRIYVRPTSYAVFGQVTVPVTDALRLTGGARYTIDEVRHNTTDGDTNISTSDRKRWRSPTFRGGVEADVGPRSLAYASISSGFKAGGFGQDGALVGSFEPEKITAYEIGTKNRLFGDRVQLNAEAFYYDYTGYQTQYPEILPEGFTNVVANAGNAKIKGAEVEINWQISAADRLSAGLALLDAHFGKFTYTNFIGTTDASGQRMPNSAKASGTASYEHIFDLTNSGKLSFRAQARLSDGYYVNSDRSFGSYQSSLVTGDAFLAYRDADETYSVSFYVKNIGDKAIRNSSSSFGAAGVATVTLDPPRTYGMMVSAGF